MNWPRRCLNGRYERVNGRDGLGAPGSSLADGVSVKYHGPVSMTSTRRLPSLALTLDIVAGVALAVALVGWLTDGAGIHLGPWTLPVREVWRPLVVALVALVLKVFAGRDPSERGAPSQVVAHVAFAFGVGTIVLLWAHYQVRYCGGADSFGYMSAAKAIATGTLVQPQPIASLLPFAGAIDAATPFGWTPAPGADALVPFYPLGFPVVVAAFMAVGGTGAGFYVPLLAGIGVLVLTYRLSRSLSSSVVAGATTVVVAFSPMVTNMTVQPMSDIPAAFWYLAAVAALFASPSRPVMAGFAFGMAVWTRPLMLVTAPALLFITGANWRIIVRFCAGAAPVMAAIAGVQWWLYGSPFRTGYGSAAGLFTTGTLAVNAWAYAKWIVIIHSPVFIVGLAAGVWRAPRRLAWAALCGLALGVLPYLFKLAYFDDWDLVRYVLPVLVPCLIVACLGVGDVLQRWLTRNWSVAAIVSCAALAAVGSYTFVANRATFHLVFQESRYSLVAEWVSTHTPPTAVVLAEGHSGSLRFYAARTTLRTDVLPAGSLAATVNSLRRNGHEVFAVVDGEEEARPFNQRMAEARGAVRAEPIHRSREAVIYRLEAP